MQLMLDAMAGVLEDQEIFRKGAPVRGSLQPGATRDVSFRVKAAGMVMFAAACGDSCSEMHMTVYGPDGSELGSDTTPLPAPTVRLEGVRAGTYRVRLHMVDCAAARCEFGVQVLAGP
jgi:hypothetical protein